MSATPAKPPKAPLYSLDGIVIGTLLGSLIAGIYMMVHNYLTLGSTRLAKQTLVFGLFCYGVVLIVSALAPAKPTLALIFAISQAGVAYLVARLLQGPSILYYAKQGATIHGLFRSALVGLLAGVVSFFIALVLYALVSL